MGKKYIIELEETPFIQHFKNGAWETIYRVKGFNSLVFDWNGLQMLTPYTEPDLDAIRKEAYAEGYKEGMQLSIDDAKLKEAYQRGLNDAWDAARTLWNMPKRKEIFGYTSFNTAFMTLTAQEAIEKIRQYEQRQEEQIQVGDEVIRHYKSEYAEGDDAPSIFLSEEDGYFRCLAFNGRSIMIAEYPKNQYRKTGRAFPEIAEVLQKMKESDNG